MLYEQRKVLSIVFVALDVLFILFAFNLAYVIRFHSIPKFFQAPIQFPVFIISYCLVWIIISRSMDLYDSKRLVGFIRETTDVLKTTVICMVIAILFSFFIRKDPISRLVLLYFLIIKTITLLSFRLVLRSTLKYIRRKGYNYRQILFVGCNKRSIEIANNLSFMKGTATRILGFVDNERACDVHGDFNGYQIIGRLEDFGQILKSYVIDEVFVTLPIKSCYSKIEEIIYQCEEVGVEVCIPTDLFSLKIAKSRIQLFEDMEVIKIQTTSLWTWQLTIKAFIDVIGAFMLLMLSLPMFVGVGILLKLSSKGPVFFRQQRIGYNGRPFTILKFRTMVEDAEVRRKELLSLNEMDGPVFKMKDDPRITKVGKFLRKTSIDELPQLINIIRGEMSFVGPRPPIPEEVKEYKMVDRRRLSMKPGLTCLWQISGRNELTFEAWMELDRQYIDNWSLLLDFKIILKTIPVVLLGRGV